MLHFDGKNNNEIAIEEINNQIQKLKLKKASLQRCAHFGFSENVVGLLMQEIDEMSNKEVAAYLEVLDTFGFISDEA